MTEKDKCNHNPETTLHLINEVNILNKRIEKLETERNTTNQAVGFNRKRIAELEKKLEKPDLTWQYTQDHAEKINKNIDKIKELEEKFIKLLHDIEHNNELVLHPKIKELESKIKELEQGNKCAKDFCGEQIKINETSLKYIKANDNDIKELEQKVNSLMKDKKQYGAVKKQLVTAINHIESIEPNPKQVVKRKKK